MQPIEWHPPLLAPWQKAERKADAIRLAKRHAELDAVIKFPREHLLHAAENGDREARARADELYENWRTR